MLSSWYGVAAGVVLASGLIVALVVLSIRAFRQGVRGGSDTAAAPPGAGTAAGVGMTAAATQVPFDSGAAAGDGGGSV